MGAKIDFLPTKCQRAINRLKVARLDSLSMNTTRPKTKTNVAGKMLYCYYSL